VSKKWLLLALIGASSITLLTLGASGVTILFSPLLGEPLTLEDTVSSFSLLALALALGLPLSLTTLGAYRGRASRAFGVGWIWLLVPLLVIVIVGGQIVLLQDLAPKLLLPPFHLLSIAVPPLLIVGAMARHFSRAGLIIRWRELLGHVAAGGFVATFASLALEAVAFAATVLLVALAPGGLEWLQETWQQLRSSPLGMDDPETLNELLGAPWGLFAVLLTVGVAAPLIEEIVKPWAAAILSGRRPFQARVFLWGVAAGAGFSLTEGLLNTPPAPEQWAVMVVARSGATAMHCLAAGLVAWGWARQRGQPSQRRWFALPLAYLSAAGLHALWNSSIIGMGLLATQVEAEASEGVQVLAGLGALGLLCLLGGLALLAPALLLGLGYRFGRQIKLNLAAQEAEAVHLSVDSEPAPPEPAEDAQGGADSVV
jgi:RsiW-degrading membrane proteinase PrsW (M82 family)